MQHCAVLAPGITLGQSHTIRPSTTHRRAAGTVHCRVHCSRKERLPCLPGPGTGTGTGTVRLVSRAPSALSRRLLSFPSSLTIPQPPLSTGAASLSDSTPECLIGSSTSTTTTTSTDFISRRQVLGPCTSTHSAPSDDNSSDRTPDSPKWPLPLPSLSTLTGTRPCDSIARRGSTATSGIS